jgi:hypothetical protein
MIYDRGRSVTIQKKLREFDVHFEAKSENEWKVMTTFRELSN